MYIFIPKQYCSCEMQWSIAWNVDILFTRAKVQTSDTNVTRQTGDQDVNDTHHSR